MAMYKTCARCSELVEFTQKYCLHCQNEVENEKKLNNKKYDSEIRNSKTNKIYTDFYHGKAWERLSEIIKIKYKKMCVCCLIKYEATTPADTTHHIKPLKEHWDERLNSNNLIPLCNECHNRVHITMRKGYEQKKAVQDMLMKLKDDYRQKYV